MSMTLLIDRIKCNCALELLCDHKWDIFYNALSWLSSSRSTSWTAELQRVVMAHNVTPVYDLLLTDGIENDIDRLSGAHTIPVLYLGVLEFSVSIPCGIVLLNLLLNHIRRSRIMSRIYTPSTTLIMKRFSREPSINITMSMIHSSIRPYLYFQPSVPTNSPSWTWTSSADASPFSFFITLRALCQGKNSRLFC